jgi:nucleoside 2-deoxyribosyltransferase
MNKIKIYVASSWRNERQAEVVAALRAAGHDVYDFKNPAPGNHGFGWKQVLIDPPPWTARQTIEVLNHPVAEKGFEFDRNAMRWADAIVMLQPCGRSAALELGWGAGAGKPTAVLMADYQEPELMLKFADFLTDDLSSIVEWVGSIDQGPPHTAEDERVAIVEFLRVSAEKLGPEISDDEKHGFSQLLETISRGDHLLYLDSLSREQSSDHPPADQIPVWRLDENGNGANGHGAK